MTPPASRVAVLLAALTLAGLCGCGGDASSDDTPARPTVAPAAPVARPALLRLWSDLAPTEVSLRPAAEGAGVSWYTASFDGEQQLYRVVETREGVFTYKPFRPRGGQLRLSTAEGRAAMHFGSVRGGEALSVTVRVRPDRPAPSVRQMPLVVCAEFKQPFDPAKTMSRQEIQDLLDTTKQASHVVTGLVGKDTLELRLDFLTDPQTVALGVYMLAPITEPGRPLVYEALQITELGQADFVAGGGRPERMPPLTDAALPQAARASLDRDERQALLAVPPASFTWEIPGGGPAVLDLSLGVRPRHAGLAGAVTFVVSVDGVELLRRRRTAPAGPAEPAWDDVLLELPPDAHRLTLATEAEGEDPPLALFGHPTVRSEPKERRPNVVLISLDTLRPDRLGCYGSDEGVSPHLDALAAEGLRWEQAYSTSSYTLPSHGSMLTGQYPAFHGAVDVVDSLSPARSPFLARMLADAGYATAAFTGGGYVSTRYGFGEGFDRYSENDPVWAYDTVRGQQLLQTMSWERDPILPELLARYDADAVVDWIGSHAEGPPFFVFLHTYIAHNYAPDEAWLRRRGLLGRDGDPDFQYALNHKKRTAYNQGEAALRQEVYDLYMPYYDATVGMADAFVGRVLAALDAAGVADDTMVVVTSDHGEEFGEHGFFGHGESLTEPVTRVPMIVRLPAESRGEAGRVLADPVSLVDVSPFILTTVGLTPDARMAVGPPLGPDRASPPERTTFVSELDNHVLRMSALRDGPLKLVVELGEQGRDLERERAALYDVAADPGEQRDLAAERGEDASRLRQRLAAFHKLAQAVTPRDGGPIDISQLDPEQVQQLRALGYLGGDEQDGN